MRALILLLVALHVDIAAAQLYSWKDANGQVHYSDQPPAGGVTPRTVAAPPLNISPGSVRSDGVQPAGTPANTPNPDDAAKAQARQAQCQKAQADLQAFQDAPRRVAVGRGGKTYAVDSGDRAAEEATLRKAVEDACQ